MKNIDHFDNSILWIYAWKACYSPFIISCQFLRRLFKDEKYWSFWQFHPLNIRWKTCYSPFIISYQFLRTLFKDEKYWPFWELHPLNKRLKVVALTINYIEIHWWLMYISLSVRNPKWNDIVLVELESSVSEKKKPEMLVCVHVITIGWRVQTRHPNIAIM